MREILQGYQKRLTNLSSNNRSLLLLRLNIEQFLDLHELDYVNGNPSWNIVDCIISRKNLVKLIPVADPRDENSNRLSNKLRKLKRRENFIFQESGAKDLYVGWPFVEGQLNDGTSIRGPLCFFPVALDQEKNDWVLRPKKEVNISFNKSLLLAFAHYNQLELSDELVEFTFDDYDKETTAFKNLLYETVRESPMAIRFGREFYGEKLERFRAYKKDEFHKTTELGELNISMQAVLGIFPQSDSYLVPDYDDLLDKGKWESVEQFFEEKSKEHPNVLDDSFDPTRHYLNLVKEDETITPFALDAYQENALNAVKKGNSIVVQGPPGTGKSQLICNLASDFIARGKKVLIVSQKRAALDVVYKRLDSIGLNDFIALVHDFKGDRKAIYDQISKQIEGLQDFKRSNSNLDALQLDRQFKKACLGIEEDVAFFDEYKHALFDESECGMSVKELYLLSNPENESINLVQEYAHFNVNDLNDFVKQLDLYLDYAAALNAESHPWSDRISFANHSTKDLKLIQEYLEEIPKEAWLLSEKLSEIVGESVDYDVCRTIAENLDKLKEIGSLIKNESIYKLFIPMASFANDKTEMLWLKNTRNLINACFAGNGLEKSIPSNEIGEIQLILKQRSDAKNTFWQSLKWKFSKEKIRLARVLVANQLSDDRAGLKVLTERLDHRLNLQHQLTKIRNEGWIPEPPKSIEQDELNQWFDSLEIALQAKLKFREFANFTEYFKLKNISAKELRAQLKSIGDTLKDLPKKRANWNKYIRPRQIDRLLLDQDFLKALRKTLKKDFDVLREIDQIRGSFNEPELATLDKLIDAEVEGKEAKIALFKNSIRLAWIDHIENKYPELRSVSTLKFDKMITDLQDAVNLKTESSAQILLQRVRENSYQGLEFNRLNNQVTYRDLQHQTTKKRRIWPLRRLISNFEDELFKLIPCWLASPEAVSAIFPMENMFDLVIFDEASQCFAEKGIPALTRGRQIVVAGDSQQLKPNDLYRVRWEDDSDDLALEVDSLLDLTKNYLLNVQLKGHYRSESLSLIAFSNKHFYGDKLKMTPHFERINNSESAIEFVKTDGIWDKQSNQIEAEKVVEIIKSIQRKKETPSIGVVTFNASQQMLIQDLLEEIQAFGNNDLFVKNIENVQGDERDIIVFSTGYGFDKKGKFNAQFGSLNQIGGENRLNVAISRARQKVIIVTSIWPEDLKVANTKNRGPKLLKEYLDFAKEVSEKNFESHHKYEREFQLDWYLKHQIKNWEEEVSTSLAIDTPYGDIALKKRNKFYGLFFTDDNFFYESLSSKEVCVYRPQMLEEKKWPYRQFHSRDFWMNRELMKDRIQKFADQQLDK